MDALAEMQHRFRELRHDTAWLVTDPDYQSLMYERGEIPQHPRVAQMIFDAATRGAYTRGRLFFDKDSDECRVYYQRHVTHNRDGEREEGLRASSAIIAKKHSEWVIKVAHRLGIEASLEKPS